ncbi:hypothetical protein BSKO_00558 [Bryopsis sp. KO-2023]|nr:hypothetical protein BSKO_00558 [Bryopsis sp. KO-2023]
MVIKQVRKLWEKGRMMHCATGKKRFFWKRKSSRADARPGEIFVDKILGKEAWKYRSSRTPDVVSAMAGVGCPRSEATWILGKRAKATRVGRRCHCMKSEMMHCKSWQKDVKSK